MGREPAPPPSLSHALGALTWPQSPLYCHQLLPARCRGWRVSKAAGAGLCSEPAAPCDGPGGPPTCANPRASDEPNAQSRLRAPVLPRAASRPDTVSPQAGLLPAPSVGREQGGGQLGWLCSHRGAACSSEGQRENSAASSRGPGSSLWATPHPARACVLPAEATVRASTARTRDAQPSAAGGADQAPASPSHRTWSSP